MGEISLSRGLKKIFVTQNLFTPSQIHRTDFYTVWFVERQFQNTAFTEGKNYKVSVFPNFIFKTTILGARIGIFKPNALNIESHIYCIDSNQILQNDRDNQVLIVGGPNMRPANPRRWTAAILNKKLCYFVSVKLLLTVA